MWPGHAQACAHAKGQKSMKRTSQILILTAALTMLAGEARADLYTFTTINVPGAAWTNVNGINDAGQIVGWGSPTPGVQASGGGFLDVGGVFTTVSLPGAGYTYPNGISNNGQIVGYYGGTPGAHGFLDVSGVFTTINAPGAYLTCF